MREPVAGRHQPADACLPDRGRSGANHRRRPRLAGGLSSSLSPCGRGWLREAKPGEGSLSRHALRDTPHPIESVSACGAALSRKGRGRSNAHRKMHRPPSDKSLQQSACSDASSRSVVTRCCRG
ncbi:hypothetical protein EOW77_0033240 [Bradyrhizobium yuanmingense]|nr:hypothetical protein EOW77_0033240 [Bradyrhizobium yuanmingense]